MEREGKGLDAILKSWAVVSSRWPRRQDRSAGGARRNLCTVMLIPDVSISLTITIRSPLPVRPDKNAGPPSMIASM